MPRVLASILVAVLAAQGTTYRSGQILTVGGTLPPSCNNGEVFVKNTVVVGLYVCVGNVWVSSSQAGGKIHYHCDGC